MYERNYQRYASQALARMPVVIKKDAHLRDFSVTGCCIESNLLENIQLNETYTIEIVPEKLSKIQRFSISAEARWIRKVEDTYYVGFFISVSPTGKLFQHFVDYLSWRPSTGESAID